ncbi:MAG: hypothetical protein L0Z50_00595 [Verrucomicrobiales bacterium]|nr:hypothetical protein [Verrucomicrobiales bacterium]
MQEKIIAASVTELRDGAFDISITGGRSRKAYVLERRDGGGPWVSVLTIRGWQR